MSDLGSAARARALEHAGRILARAMERRYGGTWRPGLGAPGPRDPADTLAGQLERVIDSEHVDAVGKRPVAGDDHDGLDEAA